VELVGYESPQTFENGLEGWQGTERVALMRDDRTAASGRYSLMVQNQRWGGMFLAHPIREGFSAGRYPLLEFDYRFHPGVMVDMILSGTHGNVGVGISDREVTQVGAVEEFTADDQWHHATVDLSHGFGRLDYRRNHYDVRRMALGDYGTYRSNGLGAYYRIDNLRLVPLISGIGEFNLGVRAHDAGGIKGYSYVWSPRPDDEPDETVDGSGDRLTFTDLPGRDAWLHIKASDNEGNWGPVRHYRFRVDGAAPTLAKSSPADGTRAAPHELVVTVADELSALNPEELRLIVDGRMYRPSDAASDYDPGKGVLRIDWLAATGSKAPVPDGKQVAMHVDAEDFAGNKMPRRTVTWTMDYSRDNVAPGRVEVETTTVKHHVLHDFQKGTHGWEGGRGRDAAQLRLVPMEEGSENMVLQITPQRGRGRMTAVALKQQVDLAEFPHLSFDCAIPEGVAVNLQVQIDGAWYEVKLTASKGAYTVVKDAGVTDDGTWQHVSVDLQALANELRPERQKHTLRAVMFGDMARVSKGEDGWRIDDLALSKWGSKQGKFRLQAPDVTGIRGYSVVVDRKRDTKAPEKITVSGNRLEHSFDGPGTWYVHVRAVDNNGNWGNTRHVSYATGPAPDPEEAGADD
jgi:hypothetical protein